MVWGVASFTMYCWLNNGSEAAASHLKDLIDAVNEEIPGSLRAELIKIGKMDAKHAERDLHRILLREGLQLPVKRTMLQHGVFFIHVVRMSAWCSYILQARPQLLLGGFSRQSAAAMLSAYWHGMRTEEPDHAVFKAHADHLERCVPYYLFFDEGRGLKKSKLLVISYETPFGFKSAAQPAAESDRTRKRKRDEEPNLADMDMQLSNLKLSTFWNRFLYGVVPHSSYTPGTFNLILEDLSKDAITLFHTGVAIDEVSYFGICVGLKGDAPALQKAGKLTRSFYQDHGKKDQANNFKGGVCAYCQAGFPQYPYEDTRSSASWRQTLYQTRPWKQNNMSPLCRIPTEDSRPEVFFKSDPFHTFKLGLARYFLASCIIFLGQEMYFTPSVGVDTILPAAYHDFSHWARKERVHKGSPNIKAFTRDKLHWPKDDVYPMGGWKASDSDLMIRWLKVFLEEGPVCQHEGTRPGRGPLFVPHTKTHQSNA